MRRISLGLVLVAAAFSIGVILVSILVRQDCPDCAGTTRLLEKNPSQRMDGPAVLDCPRCGDRGRISLLNSRLGRPPDSLIAALMRHSNRETWRSSDVRDRLEARLRESPLRTSSGDTWADTAGLFGRSRFIQRDGRTYVLLLTQVREWVEPDEAPARVFLFDSYGLPLDTVELAVRGGQAIPRMEFVIPCPDESPCVRIQLLSRKVRPVERIEIDHAGSPRTEPPRALDKDSETRIWSLRIHQGKLWIAEER